MKLKNLFPYVGLFAALFLVNCSDDDSNDTANDSLEQGDVRDDDEVVVDEPVVVDEVVVDEPVVLPEKVSFIQFDEAGVDYTLGGANVFVFSNGDDPTTDVVEPTTTLNGNAVTDAPMQPNSNDTTALEVLIDTDGFGFAGLGIPLENINVENIDFSGANKTITVSVWSEVAFVLQVAIGNGRDENGVDIVDPRPAFKTAPHSGNGWEDIVIDFSTASLFNPFVNAPGAPMGGTEIPAAELGEVSGTYNSIQFQFNDAPSMGMSTFYIDNVSYN